MANGGVSVDSWHHFRGRADDDLLRALPPEKVFMIHLDDGAQSPRDPNFLVDTMQNRLPPGQGDFALEEFLQLLWNMRVQAPISVEVLSTGSSERSPDDVAITLGRATRSLVGAARRSGTDRLGG